MLILETHIVATNTGISINLFWCYADFNTIFAHFKNVSGLFLVVTDVSEEHTAAPPEPDSEAHHC